MDYHCGVTECVYLMEWFGKCFKPTNKKILVVYIVIVIKFYGIYIDNI